MANIDEYGNLEYTQAEYDDDMQNTAEHDFLMLQEEMEAYYDNYAYELLIQEDELLIQEDELLRQEDEENMDYIDFIVYNLFIIEHEINKCIMS